MLKFIRYGSIALIAVLVSGVGIKTVLDQNKGEPENISGFTMGGPMTLISADGIEVSEAQFKGKPQVLYFGFTHCPDVCPTTLWDMQAWMDGIGDDLAEKLHFAMITVDPERDTPELLKSYLTAFDPRIKAYTATPEMTQEILKNYRIYAKKVVDPDDPESYTMDHTASVILLDASSKLVGTVAYLESGETAVQKLKNLVQR